MEITFQGKRALVTGAGKGIGRTTAVRLAELGANVIAISRTQADLDSLKAEVGERAGEFKVGERAGEFKVPSIETWLLDIADWDKTRHAVEQMGPIDLLVNNAGITNWTTFLEVTKEELYNLHDINFKAAFNISQVVARGMVARGSGGAIVNVSSIAAKRAMPKHTIYCSSKAALDMLSATMAVDLGPHKIRVNSVNPGLVMTAMGKRGFDLEKKNTVMNRTPLGCLMEEKDVADAIVYLLSDRAAMITGHTLPVDGGLVNVA